MWSQDWTVSGEIVEVVHNDSNKQVDHDKAAKEDETNKVEISGVAATTLVRVEQFSRCFVSGVGLFITRSAALTRQHNVRPGLTSGTSANNKSCIF